MKRIIVLIFSLIALSIFLVSCGNEEETKIDVYANDPFFVYKETISGAVYNTDNINIASYITFSKGEVSIYKEKSFKTKLDMSHIHLNEGENVFYIKVELNKKKFTYNVIVQNYTVKSLEVKTSYEKEYTKESLFDKYSVLLMGKDVNGEDIFIGYYDVDYDFSTEGEKNVILSIPGLSISYKVVVKGEYIPDITDKMTSKEGIVYIIENGYAYITSGEEFKGDFVCPEYVILKTDKIKVKGIKKLAFSQNTEIKSVKCDLDYTIEEGAFEKSGLQKAIFTKGTFESFVFADCEKLVSVTLPENIDNIPNSMFSNCKMLNDFEFGDNIKSIGAQAFHGCESIERVILPKSVTYIGPRAFKNCTSLIMASCNVNTETISEEAFSFCPNLKVLLVPALSNFEDASIVKGDDKVTVYTGESTPLLYYLKNNGIGNQSMKTNSIYVINEKDTYNIGEEFDYRKIIVCVYSDDEIRICDDFGYTYNFSIPGETKVEIRYKEYSKQIDINVEYILTLKNDYSDRGEYFKFDEDNKYAYLVSLPDTFVFDSYENEGTYILPTKIFVEGEYYEVKGISTGAIKGKDYIKRLYIGSRIDTIEDEAICNCDNIELIYVGVPFGRKLDIGENNFKGFKDNCIIMCYQNNSNMHIYVRRNNLMYCGIYPNKLYINTNWGAKTSYEREDVLILENYNAIYVDYDLIPHVLDFQDVTISYDFKESNEVLFEYDGIELLYKISLID